MKTCRACRKTIDLQATKCPYCQTEFSELDMAAGKRERASLTRRKLIAFVLILAAGFIWLVYPGNVENLAETTAKIDYATGAEP